MRYEDILSLREAGHLLIPQTATIQPDGYLFIKPLIQWSSIKKVYDHQPDVNKGFWVDEDRTPYDGKPIPQAVSIYAGINSGNFGAFDLDCHKTKENEAFFDEITTQHKKCIEAAYEKFPQLYYGKTRSGGYRIGYRLVNADDIPKDLKTTFGTLKGSKCVEQINHDWNVFVPPSPQYSDLYGSLLNVGWLTTEEFKALNELVSGFYEKEQEQKDKKYELTEEDKLNIEKLREANVGKTDKDYDDGSVLCNFRKRGGIFKLYEEKGWQLVKEHKGFILIKHPDAHNPQSLAVDKETGVSYCFSDNTVIPDIPDKNHPRITRTGKAARGWPIGDTACLLLYGKECLEGDGPSLRVKSEYMKKCIEELELRGYKQSFEWMDAGFSTSSTTTPTPTTTTTVTQNKESSSPALIDENPIPEFDLWPESWLREFRDQVADNAQVDKKSVDGILLAVLSLFTCRYAKVFWKRYEPTNLMVLIGMNPSERKSSIFSNIFTPIMEMDEESKKEYKKQLSYKEEQLNSLAIKIKSKSSGKHPDYDEAERLMHERANLKASVIRRIKRWVPSEFNIEALHEICQHNRCILLASPEPHLIDYLTDRNSSKKIEKFILGSWSGDGLGELRVDIEKERSFMERYLSILLMTQFEVLERLTVIKDREGSGFNSRFMTILPKTKLGNRIADVEAVRQDLLDRWEDALLDLDKRHPVTFTFEEKALKLLIYVNNTIEKQLPQMTDAAKYYFGKIVGHLCRLSGILHAVSSPIEDNIIKLETLKKACYFLASCEGASEEINSHADIPSFQAIKTLYAKFPEGGFNSSRATQKKSKLKVKVLKSAIKEALDMGCLAFEKDNYVWKFNPSESIDTVRFSGNLIMKVLNEGLKEIEK